MAFPVSPTNGQTAVVNNITYQFSNVGNTWTRLLSTANTITANTIVSNGVVSAVGNVYGNYIIGNVACASGIFTTKIFNGNSEANIGTSGGNANISIGGTSNVAVFATTGEYITGVLSASGNVTGGNVLTAGLVSATGTVTGSSHLGTVVSVTANVTGGNLLTGGLVSATANVTGGNILTGGLVSATANVTGGNILTGGLISATSTITSAANITGGNVLTGGLISATGTITGSSHLGSVISVTANVTGGNVLTGGLISATSTITSAANVTGGNLLTGGLVSATANITGGNVLTGGLISATSTITSAANITGGNVLTGGLISATGTVTGSSHLGSVVSVTANITGGNLLTGGIVSSTGNVVSAGNIIASKIVSANDQLVVNSTGSEGGQLVLGWAGVNGLTGQANSTWMMDVDASNVLRVFYQNATGGTSVLMQANAASNIVTFPSAGVSATGNVSAPYFIGNGSQLTGVTSTSTSIVNGTSNVVVAASGNITANVAGAWSAQFISSGILANQVWANNNGNGTNFKVGDDAWLGDINSADTIRLSGQQNAANGWIVFGNADGTQLGRAGSGPLTYGAAFSAAGNVTGGNILTGGLISSTANITGGNILTGGLISASSTITSAANITGGNLSTGGQVSSAGNVTGGNLLTGGLISATGRIFAASGNASAPGVTFSADTTQDTGFYWISDGNIGVTTNGAIQASFLDTGLSVVANVRSGNILTGGLVSATANITGGNLLTAGQISATGTITSNGSTNSTAFAVGNSAVSNVALGMFPTAGTAGEYAIRDYSNVYSAMYFDVGMGGTANGAFIFRTSNSFRLLANVNSSGITTPLAISATGNITGGNVLFGAGIVSGTGNIYGGNIVGTIVATSFSTTGNITGGNLLTSGLISATGRIFAASGNASAPGITFSADTGQDTGLYWISDGNIGITTNNGLRATFLDTGLSVVANVTGGNVLTGGLISATSTITSAANITGGNILTGGLVSATANITGGNILTAGVMSSTGNATHGNILTAGLVSATGNVVGGNITTSGNVVATGNLSGGNVAATTNVYSFGTIQGNGNVSGGNLLTAGLISATGNIIGGNVNTNALRPVSGALTISTVSGNLNLQPTSGNIVVNSTYINGVTDPAQAQDVATKNYVDTMVSTQISYHTSVLAATVSNAATFTGGTITYTQPNGASNGVGALLTTTGSFNLVDTANIQTVGTRVLIKNEANSVFNGVYTWANATNLVRAVDADEYGPDSANALSINDYFFVTGGNVNAGSAYIVSAPTGTITFGTSNITFAQFSSSQTYTANTSAGISLNGTVINAKIDGITTAFDGGGNIIVKASANLTTPNIGAATGTSLSVTANVTGGNVLTGGLVSATGTVTGSSLLGSVVSVSANVTGGNVLTGGLVSASGNVTGGNLITSGLVSATSNITGGNLITGGLISATSTITSAANITGGNVLTGGLISATANVTGGNILTAGVMSSTGNAIHGNVLTGGLISATSTITSAANITGGNILTAGIVSAAGNIIGATDLYVGNGAASTAFTNPIAVFKDTGLTYVQVAAINSSGNGSADFTAYGNNGDDTQSWVDMGFTGNTFNDTNYTVTAAGDGYLFSQGNASFGGNLVLATGATGTTKDIVFATGGFLAGNIKARLVNSTGAFSVTANVVGGNLLTGGVISATSTITSAANITGGNVLTGGLVSATANITGGNILTAGVMSSTGNATHGNILTAGQISATGNITGNFYIGNGAFLTGLNVGASNSISNGATNISIPVSSGNIAMSVGGASNTVVINLGSLTMYGTFAGPKTLTANVSVANAVNALLLGPVTVADGYNLTVPDASTLYVYAP